MDGRSYGVSTKRFGNYILIAPDKFAAEEFWLQISVADGGLTLNFQYGTAARLDNFRDISSPFPLGLRPNE